MEQSELQIQTQRVLKQVQSEDLYYPSLEFSDKRYQDGHLKIPTSAPGQVTSEMPVYRRICIFLIVVVLFFMVIVIIRGFVQLQSTLSVQKQSENLQTYAAAQKDKFNQIQQLNQTIKKLEKQLKAKKKKEADKRMKVSKKKKQKQLADSKKHFLIHSKPRKQQSNANQHSKFTKGKETIPYGLLYRENIKKIRTNIQKIYQKPREKTKEGKKIIYNKESSKDQKNMQSQSKAGIVNKKIQQNQQKFAINISIQPNVTKINDSLFNADNFTMKSSNQNSIVIMSQNSKNQTKSIYNTSNNQVESIQNTQKNQSFSQIIQSIQKNQTEITLNSAQNIIELAQNISKNQSSSSFTVPKKLWVFRSPRQKSHTTVFIKNNHRSFAQKSGFKVYQINQKNYINYIDKTTGMYIQTFKKTFLSKLSSLKQKANLAKNLNNLAFRVVKSVILSQVLLQNGGVIVDNELLLTQRLQWLQQINNNSYVNRDLRDKGTQVFGFYDLRLSSNSFNKNYNTTFQIIKPYRMFKQLPAMTTQLIAAIPNAKFIKQISTQLLKILVNPKRQFEQINSNQKLKNIFNKRKYWHFWHSWTIAALRIIINKADKCKKINNQTRNIYDMAFNQFGLSLMNGGYGPKKLQYELLEKFGMQKRYLTEVPIEQLQALFGDIRYCAYLPNDLGKNSYFFNQIKRRSKNYRISNGSFFQKMFYKNSDKLNIIKQKQVFETDLNGSEWATLPKRLWVIWDGGFQKAPLGNQLTIKHVIQKARQYGINATLVTKSNIHMFLDEKTLSRIEHAIKNAKFKVHRPVRSNLWRIALVYKHGGIYIDSTVILTQNFDWLYFISRVNKSFIWNRYGSMPKIVLPFNMWIRSPDNWRVRQTISGYTKSATNLEYQNSFFAAEPESQLLHDWFELYLNNLVHPYNHTANLLRKAKILNWRSTSSKDAYLIAMQSLRLVICLKQREIQSKKMIKWRNANHYYGAWLISMHAGISKYRCHKSNHFYLDNPFCTQNNFLTDYSQQYTQGLIGKVNFFVKLHNRDAKNLNQRLKNKVNSIQQLHSGSIVYKHLLSHGQSLVKENGKIKWNFKFQDI